jgi:hypothetical protein
MVLGLLRVADEQSAVAIELSVRKEKAGNADLSAGRGSARG